MQPLSFAYTVTRSRRKTLSIRITETGVVEVRCPLFVSRNEIERILRSKQAYIESKLNNLKKQPPIIPFTPEELSVLKMQAQAELIPHILRRAAQIGVSCGRITIRSQKSRWGSCSGKGNLNFNCLLMLAPPEVRDYVIVHELCHLRHMNHSTAFWKEVETFLPDYRKHQKWLKESGESLIRRLPA